MERREGKMRRLCWPLYDVVMKAQRTGNRGRFVKEEIESKKEMELKGNKMVDRIGNGGIFNRK